MKNLFDVSGKVAVVTGGSRGIGLMIARGYVENGVKTYISSRKVDVCNQAAAQLSELGECISIPMDLSTVEGAEALAKAIGEREEKLDILVNNAGATWGAPIDEFPEEGWDKVMDINLKGPFFLTQKLLPLLRAAATYEEPARVINIASIDGYKNNSIETYSYAASKAGMVHLTRHMARNLAPSNVVVNAIAPGPFESKMMEWTLDQFGDHIRDSNPRKRIGRPEDMAGAAIFLASKASDFIVGETIKVDGGIVNCA
jgi:NAD(P)-dependent dehydrogenase (short-subunit alcohol dehydrogenase family)